MKIAINGFGRIGRPVFKIAMDHPEVEAVAINDLADLENLAYLLKYDTVYGVYQKDVQVKDGNLIVGGKEIKCFSEKDPANLPWGELEIDMVVESTGVFRDRESAGKHLEAGAGRVIITAPAKDESIKTIVLGVNEEDIKEEDKIISNASCTTNCIAPMMKVLDEKFGIEKSLMSTIHSYTSSQSIVDGPSKKDFRRGRAAAYNVVPTSTGAALASALTLPQLDGIFDGMAYRVPTLAGSVSDIVAVLKEDAKEEEINKAFREAEEGSLKDILKTSDEPLVSHDILGSYYSVIVQTDLTKVTGGNLVKAVGWYDNEWGYSARVIDLALKMQ
ncbi:MAG: type I glyceraldehyde-3-phosphate dehydrogenase [Candidatus Moranbacteria bacterium]|nr:type I glyceraldehyde-3-phosphate dehydrogenase [Candidatus Moranbacteria bacterium]